MSDNLRTYIQQIQHEESKRLQEAEAEAKLAESIRTIKHTKPLAQQIAELMRTVPPALRNRPWSMEELVSRLTGRYRDRPHAKNVGEELRKLGWQRVRLWSAGGEGRRVWVDAER